MYPMPNDGTYHHDTAAGATRISHGHSRMKKRLSPILTPMLTSRSMAKRTGRLRYRSRLKGMARKASMATHSAIIIMYSGWSPQCMARLTGPRNAHTPSTKRVEVVPSDMTDVEYTSMGSCHRS